MTHYTEFEKAVKHVKDCLFWDFGDGVWNDVIVTPLDRDYFNRLMQQVSDAHACEAETLNAENAKLRELVRDMYDFWGVDDDELGFAFKEEVTFSASVRDRMRELGVIDE